MKIRIPCKKTLDGVVFVCLVLFFPRNCLVFIVDVYIYNYIYIYILFVVSGMSQSCYSIYIDH